MSENGTPTGRGPKQGEILGPDDTFLFQCHGGLSCFTGCCRDVTIFLTPYDVLRLRQRVGLTSREFLDRHALVSQAQVIPLVLLRMNEEDEKRCYFVTREGCSVYEDRPWACRMYPLDLGEEGGYRVAVGEDRCKGFGQGEPRRVRVYLESQEVGPYVAEEKLFQAISNDPRVASLDVNNPAIFQMVFMATYNLDAFREFVFQSSFLQRFALPKDRVERMRTDDLELLHFGYEWLEFGLFGKMTFQISEDAAQKMEARSAAGSLGGVSLPGHAPREAGAEDQDDPGEGGGGEGAN